eukprot:gene5836-8052_t
MSSSKIQILKEIVQRLKENSDRATFATVFSLTNSIVDNVPPTIEQYILFLDDAYEFMIGNDSSKRSSILRVLRYVIELEQHITLLVDSELHYLIVLSLEGDVENAVERMQALKLIRKIFSIKTNLFPICFVRSLVAIANYKEDSFRKICLEVIRELAVANPVLVASTNGFPVLMDAIIEPVTQELANSILLTILYLLNDIENRKIVSSHIDLRTLLSPFTDLDADSKVLESKWVAAKAALVTMMRTWVGVCKLTSDELGLPTLIKMLKDTKVPTQTHNVILDAVGDILGPISSKIKSKNRKMKQQGLVTALEAVRGLENIRPVSSNSIQSLSSTPDYLPTSDTHGAKLLRCMSEDSLEFSGSNHSSLRGSNVFTEVAAPIPLKPIRNSLTEAPVSMSHIHFSSSNLVAAGMLPQRSVTPTEMKPKGGGILNKLFGSINTSPALDKTSTVATHRRTSTSAGSLHNMGLLKQNSSTASFQTLSNSTEQASSKTPQRGVTRAGTTTAFSMNYAEERPQEFDPIFNMMDNYTALLCCSFLHVGLIESLFFLGTHGSISLATKSRNLLVCFLQILANIFPERKCSELLTMPLLLEFAATISIGGKINSRSHKSSQVLLALADAFSVMPYKQTSGSHVSGLQPPAQIIGRYRSTSAAEVRVRNGSSVQITQPTNGSIPPTVNGNQAVVQRSNFVPLNIQTIFELAEEIKISSSCSINNVGRNTVEESIISSHQNSSTTAVIKSLQTTLTPVIDKNDFIRQSESSKVIGREGKEPFKWDWVMISDMLEYSFQNPVCLAEGLKSKWIRRLSGFYRCSVDEKGFFANLDWEPTNLQYLECASNLYSVLLRDEAGMSFLTSDRRGMLFNEIAHELHSLAEVASNKYAPSGSAIPTKNVFRPISCFTTMSREFFTLIGRIIRNPGSRHILDGANILTHLAKLGGFVSLDYISRLAFTSLSLADEGNMSKHLLQLWTTQYNCSYELKLYLHNILRILILSKPQEWCIDAIVNQIISDDAPTPIIFKALEEAIHNKSYLLLIIVKRPKITDEPLAQGLLTRFCSIPEGIVYLNQRGWLGASLDEWKKRKCDEYAINVEESISMAFSMASTDGVAAVNKNGGGIIGENYTNSSTVIKIISPIPVQTLELIALSARLSDSQINTNSVSSVSAQYKSHSEPNNDPNADLVIDLQGLVRLPWNIEAKLHSPPSIPSQNITSSNSEYLKIDTFLDSSDMVSPICYDTTSDSNRIVKVRGIILDSKGIPSGVSIAPNRIISNTLLIGVCAVNRFGRINATNENRPPRRKASITTARETTNQIQSSNRQSMSNNNSLHHSTIQNVIEDIDLPVTYQLDYLYDWSICKPGHRQANTFELEDGKFAVMLKDDPVVWIFSRRMPGVNGVFDANKRRGSTARQGSMSNVLNNSRSDQSRAGLGSGGSIYLVEIQYYLKIETGQALFVPMPRHMYGELSRTLEGCEQLEKLNIVRDLLKVVRSPLVTNLDLRSALWSLGHIGSNELGFTTIDNIDPVFVEWCIDNVKNSTNFCSRGIFFFVLGLLSRNIRGCRKLMKLQWDSVPIGSHSAVAIPKDPSELFAPQPDESTIFGSPTHATTRPLQKRYSHVLSAVSSASAVAMAEHEVLNLISKMPGIILYRDCKNKLDKLKRDSPDLFKRRNLFIEVHKMFESYSFKLSVRREIMALFDNEAKIKSDDFTNSSDD